jgi:hypothetical protein
MGLPGKWVSALINYMITQSRVGIHSPHSSVTYCFYYKHSGMALSEREALTIKRYMISADNSGTAHAECRYFEEAMQGHKPGKPHLDQPDCLRHSQHLGGQCASKRPRCRVMS